MAAALPLLPDQRSVSDELCKPITDHKSIIEIQDAIVLLVSMLEIVFGMQYKHDDNTTATNLINAQLETIMNHVTSTVKQIM